MHFLVKWIKFSVKKNKTLKKYWKNGPKYWKSQGILSVRKSGNPVPDVSSWGRWGEGPQMNKFEQVSSDHHQLSLAGGRVVGVPGLMSGGGRESRVPGLMSGGGSRVPRSDDCGGGERILFSDIQCMMGNGQM